MYVYMLLLISLGFFYFTLGNLAPRYRSKLSSIQLLGIVKRRVIEVYGMNAILKPFVDDLKKLVCVYKYNILALVSCCEDIRLHLLHRNVATSLLLQELLG